MRAWRGRRWGFGRFFHPSPVAIDSETEAVLGLLDAQIWTREDAIEAAPRRQRAIEDKESMRWLRGVERAGALLTDAASVVVVGDRESDIYSCFARRAAGVDLIVRAAQDRLTAGAQQGPAGDASLFTSPAAWPELTQIDDRELYSWLGAPALACPGIGTVAGFRCALWDDIVAGFEHEADGRRFWEAMRGRLEEFSLSLHPKRHV